MLLLLLASLLAPAAGASPVDELRAWLGHKPDERPPLLEQRWARTPLAKEQAREAADLLWQDLVGQVKQTNAQEWNDKRIKLDGLEMKFDYHLFGEKPVGG